MLAKQTSNRFFLLALRAGVMLLCFLAISFAELQPIAQTLTDLGPDLLADPDVPTGEPSAAMMAVWNALPVFALPASRSGLFFGTFGRRVDRSAAVLDTLH